MSGPGCAGDCGLPIARELGGIPFCTGCWSKVPNTHRARLKAAMRAVGLRPLNGPIRCEYDAALAKAAEAAA